MKPLILFFVLALHTHIVLGQQKEKEDEMYVDMPDESEETNVLKKGEGQVETAFLHNKYKEGPHSSISQLLVRYGAGRRVELRILSEQGNHLHRYIEETVQSTYPLSIGTKILLVEGEKAKPSIAFVGYLNLPVTIHGKSKDHLTPIFLAAFQNEFTEKFKLEYNGGIQQSAFSKEWSELVNASVHYKLLDPLEVFFEFFAQYQHHASPENNLGGGVAYQFAKNLEFYVSGGRTIGQSEYNRFISGGLAIRIR